MKLVSLSRVLSRIASRPLRARELKLVLMVLVVLVVVAPLAGA